MLPACLHAARRIKEAHEALEPSDSLHGREFQLWRPLLAICQVAMPDIYDELRQLAEEVTQFKAEEGDVGQIETILLRYLMQMDGDRCNISLKALTEKVQESLPWIESWHPVKSALTNLQVTKARWNTSEGVKYKLDLQRVRERGRKRGITPLQEEPTPSQTDASKPNVIDSYLGPDAQHKDVKESEKKRGLTEQETLVLLRNKWTKGYAQDFTKLLADVRKCSLEDSERLFQKWLDKDGLVAYDPDGWLTWVTR